MATGVSVPLVPDPDEPIPVRKPTEQMPSVTCACGFQACGWDEMNNLAMYEEHDCPDAPWHESMFSFWTFLMVIMLGIVLISIYATQTLQ